MGKNITSDIACGDKGVSDGWRRRWVDFRRNAEEGSWRAREVYLTWREAIWQPFMRRCVMGENAFLYELVDGRVWRCCTVFDEQTRQRANGAFSLGLTSRDSW